MRSRLFLLTTVACCALSAPAFADDAEVLKRLDAMQKMLEAQQHQIEQQRSQIESQSREIASLKRSGVERKKSAVAQAVPQTSPAQTASQQAQIDALKIELDSYKTTQRLEKQDEPVWSFASGRPVVQSPDGRFSLGLRGLGQFDNAYYDQDDSASRLSSANGGALSSGSNFRRAQLGIQGKLFGDWSYLFNYDFGGSSGNEQQGRVQAVYAQYDGLAPFALRVGAYPPPANIEDGTASGDTIFLERNAPAEIARGIAGSDGRDAITALYTGGKLYAALSLTGGKVADSNTYAGEQRAVLGRVSDLFYSDNDWRLLAGVNGSYVFTPPFTNTVGPNGAHTITFSTSPELTVDDTGTKLVSTGAINAEHAYHWGVEGAAQWRSLYGQAGYFGYGIDRVATGLSNPNFDGWYLQGTWVLTGERRGYSAANGAFTSPKPSVPLSLKGGGWGAWELAARYSDLDLNYHEGQIGSAMPADGVRGGEQKIWTAGINWYPNSLLRFALDYQHVSVDRIGSTAAPVVANTDIGQSFDVISLRTQFGF
ncbi:porin [Parvibaculum sedimenti]|uniref:Porin n=1 Tax=Parvibaculum sedimenti TaxID=2608632 RepID=A0A6N6VFW0_9HYPH|nr:porin [Parvibaculum sedimenti]KAB7738774.1 porin [Parvibaculum sedimenti]